MKLELLRRQDSIKFVCWIKRSSRSKVVTSNWLKITKKSCDFFLLDKLTIALLVRLHLCAAPRKDHIIDELRDTFTISISEHLADNAL